jgi:AmiR/NasT family two-component response regulator
MLNSDDEVIVALGPRDTIIGAVALLREEHDVDEEVAFEMLVRGAVDSSQRVRTVAATVIRQSTGAHDN